MTDVLDQRIAAFLRERAPAARDPRFRLEVLALREAKEFRRRTLALVGAGAAVGAVAVIGAVAGGEMFETAAALLLGAVLAAAALLAAPRLRRLPRLLHRFGL
jgi:hypothetical protein